MADVEVSKCSVQFPLHDQYVVHKCVRVDVKESDERPVANPSGDRLHEALHFEELDVLM